jgi:para-aminobenzoate synthetase/4-amino-4-deoxychorismate lyase
MAIIEELETTPRGLYTGAIGFLKPGGDCIFNVAIRTVVLDSLSGEAKFSVGGGVTIDSTSDVEYEECLLKAEFLNRKPVNFNIFESLRLENGRYFLIERHLERLAASACYFDFKFHESEIANQLQTLATSHEQGRWKVRLELEKSGVVQTSVSEIAELEPRRAALASSPVDQSDRFLFHKTTNRQFYDEELALHPDCDDLIFWNQKGEITESTIANVVAMLDGQLVTPPLESGLLAGTYRDELIAEETISEQKITVEDLARATEIYLINSVRKWMKVSYVKGINPLVSTITR